MNRIRNEIKNTLTEMRAANETAAQALNKEVSLDALRHLVKDGIWTNALQTALNEYEVVRIPAASEPYWIDRTVTVPSNTRIVAESGAVIRQCEGVRVLMLRNEHTVNGTHSRNNTLPKDENISIEGGIWEESHDCRGGYGKSGMYDEERSYYGVSTAIFFNNVRNLTMKNMTFRHTAGFGAQFGELENGVFENIVFDGCFADGLHFGGYCENLWIRNVSGQVGDDLVALNMYDWQNSSVNFGPIRNVLCEGLVLAEDSRYKALRIEPGLYCYDDGSTVDCSLTRAIIRDVKGIRTFKLYFQTPRYLLSAKPERGGVGHVDQVFFEDITIDLARPIDGFDAYMNSDPITGTFAAFEAGAIIGTITLSRIDLTLHRDRFPYSYLFCIGPKSVRKGDYEIFDPYLSSSVDTLILEDIRINGERITDATPYVREIVFDHLYEEAPSTAKGEIKQIILR